MVTRRIGEAVVIGDVVAVRVIGITGAGQVVLMIEAPRAVTVLREELLKRPSAPPGGP